MEQWARIAQRIFNYDCVADRVLSNAPDSKSLYNEPLPSKCPVY